MPYFKQYLLCILFVCLVGLRSNIEARATDHDMFVKQELYVDVEKLRNASTCKYYVKPFEPYKGYSKYQGLLPKQLYHVICLEDELSTPCMGDEPNKKYKCIQTYKKIQMFDPKFSETLYTGCVCAYQDSNTTSPDDIKK